MILTRYILREFFRIASGAITLCVFFFVLFDFIQKAAGYLGKYNPSARLLSEYYLMQMPFEMYQTLPIASLIAAIVVIMLLTRSGETIAMSASGMSPLRIILPITMGAFFVTLFAFFLSELVIPYTSKRSHYIKQVAIEGENVGLSEGAYWLRSPEYIVNFKSFNAYSQTLEGVKLLKLSEDNFTPLNVVQAKRALYVADSNSWLLSRVHSFQFDKNKNFISASEIPFMVVELPIQPKSLIVDRRLPFELSFSEINTLLMTGQQKNGDLLSYRIAWYVKLAYPFSSFLLSFLAVRFVYRFERTRETLRGLFLILAFAISYWFVLSVSKALCSAGRWHPFFAGWSANIWLSLVIFSQFFSLKRKRQ